MPVDNGVEVKISNTSDIRVSCVITFSSNTKVFHSSPDLIYTNSLSSNPPNNICNYKSYVRISGSQFEELTFTFTNEDYDYAVKNSFTNEVQDPSVEGVKYFEYSAEKLTEYVSYCVWND